MLMAVLAFLLVLGPLVVVHELGHYLVGRWFGVKAEAFSVGFGKELFGRTDRHGTRWKLCAIPMGGYVQFVGDANAASMPDASGLRPPPGSLNSVPLWQRALVVAAGPVTNLLVAIAIFAAFNLAFGKVVALPEIALFSKNSAAERAGMKIGDKITAIDGATIESFTDIPERIAPFPGRTLEIRYERNGEDRVVGVTIASELVKDKFGNESRIGRLGIGAGKVSVEKVGVAEALSLAGSQTWGVMRMMVTGLKQIFTGERSVKELGGPVKIAKYSGEQLSLGWLSFVSFVALISINLAFINLLPIPSLDGGHLVLYAAEAVRRKPLDAQSQEWAFRTGLALMLALTLIVTFNDLVSLSPFGR